MIYKIFIFLFALPLFLKGQESPNNFNVKNNELIWQKVFEYKGDGKAGILKKVIIESPIIADSTVSGKLTPISPANSLKAPKKGRLSFDIKRVAFTGNVLIEFKNGRYRVTVSKITTHYLQKGILNKEGESILLDTDAIDKKGEVDPIFLNHESIIYDSILTDAFTITSDTDENW